MSGRETVFQDSLYGRVQLEEVISSLAAAPLVQRLRQVRLSNIDSIDMPGIANISRYEHVLGVAYLATQVAFRSRLSRFDDLVLRASALLHDWAITSFGHLLEEAFQYVGAAFDHEERLSQIASGNTPEEIFGISRQILVGRETGLPQWIRAHTNSEIERHELLVEITKHIKGKGRFGRVISGDIDLDNIDNVFRMAYHLGLPIDRDVPLLLARAMIDYDPQTGCPVFKRAAERNIQVWSTTRANVYDHLMLAQRDFAGKVMLMYAAIRAIEVGEIKKVDWSLTDFQFITKLLSSLAREVKDTVERWIAGELWTFTPLHWMRGERPHYTDVRNFSVELSKRLDRQCFAYAIKDKRDRHLQVRFDDGSTAHFGKDPHQWLLGVGSSERRAFTATEIVSTLTFAESHFNTTVLGPASPAKSRTRAAQPSLL